MESQEKKKLAVVTGKRMAPESDSTDASMEDLCRKKFKPIAPKPVIRKDQHQAVLSTALPLRKESSQRKEHVVLPTPKFDPSSGFGMRPGSSFPFMCGGPMIMPIPVPVVPGKDGSYVPLQMPVPIPVMVPVVVSVNQASPGVSNIFTSVASDSKHTSSSTEKESPGGTQSSKKDKSSKKGASSKQDKTAQPGDGSENKGPKTKPCRYKYSMIKNESLFRDILRGVGGDFMASHGISLAVPPGNAIDVSSLSKGMVLSLDQNKQNPNENTNETSDSSPSRSSKAKDFESASTPAGADDVQEVSEGSAKTSGDVTIVPPELSKPQSTTAPGSLVTSSRGADSSNNQVVYSSYSVPQPMSNDRTVTASAASSVRGPPVCQSGPQVSNFSSFQNPSTLNMYPSVRMSEGNPRNKQPHGNLSMGMRSSSSSQTSVHSFPYYNTSNQNSVPSSLMNLPVSTPSSSIGSNNNLQQLRSQCPPTSSVSSNVPHNSNWSYAEGNQQNPSRNEQQNRHVLRPFHNLAQRIAAVRNAEHDHPDESNFYGVDELHSFSEMDQSAGSLLSSSDDSVSAVLGMTDAAGSVSGTLSDSPNRRAVTAIVTPLPRSVSLTTTTVTSTSVNSQVSGVPSSTQAGVQNYNRPTAQTQGLSGKGSFSGNAQGSSHVNNFALPSSSVSQPAQQWNSPNSGTVRQPGSGVTSSQNPYNVGTANTNSAVSRNQPSSVGHFSAPLGQQRSMQPEGMQGKTSSSIMSSTSTSISKDHGTFTQTCQSPHSASQTTLSYSSGPRSTSSVQRQPSSMSNNFSMPNLNTNHTNVPQPNYYNNSDRPNESFGSTTRDRNPMQNNHQVPNPALGVHGQTGYPDHVHSQDKQTPYPRNTNSNDTSPNKALAGSTQCGNRQSQMQNSAQTSSAISGNRQNENQMPNPAPTFSQRPQSSMVPAVTNSQAASSSYGSGNFYHTSRSQAPETTPTVTASSVAVATTSSAMGAALSNPWQPSWAANVPISQGNQFPSGGSGHQRPVSHEVTGPSQAGVQARHDITTTVMTSTSVQSVPLQSNVQTRHSVAETLPSSSNQSGNHTSMLDRRVSSSNSVHLPGSVQTPIFGSNNLRQPSAPASSSTSYNVPSTDAGPRMPYPLVPPIMFGNSAPPPRGIPMGSMHSVPLPGSFPTSSVSDQNLQSSQVTSSSAVHHSIPPVMHDRHRMYLPSHFSTLHRPLYMPPSPAPSTDLSMLSPHSCGPLHVHDSVLYSPRYPSSIHSLSPGVNTNFHASPLHRTFPSSDHQENFGRSSIGHPSPHYDSTLSPMPLRMSQLGQSSTGVNNAVSSHSTPLPPAIASLQHSSIVANREQNSLFEQNLKRLLERSARRQSMAFSSTHGYPRPMPCDHTFPPRPMSSLPSFSAYPPPHSTCTAAFSTPFSTPPTLTLSQPNQPQSMPRQPPPPLPSRHNTTTTTSSNTVATSTTVTTVSTTLTPTTSSVVTSRAILGNTSDKYLPLELLSPSDSSNPQATPTTSAPSTPSPQVTVDMVVKCGDTVLQCSRQVLRESGRTVLCCWHCDYHTAEPRKMKRHQKKENEPLKCQLCSFQSGSRCSVNQHYKQEHMDKDDPFRAVSH